MGKTLISLLAAGLGVLAGISCLGCTSESETNVMTPNIARLADWIYCREKMPEKEVSRDFLQSAAITEINKGGSCIDMAVYHCKKYGDVYGYRVLVMETEEGGSHATHVTHYNGKVGSRGINGFDDIPEYFSSEEQVAEIIKKGLEEELKKTGVTKRYVRWFVINLNDIRGWRDSNRDLMPRYVAAREKAKMQRFNLEEEVLIEWISKN